jgi:hypothetical protein
VLGDWGIRVRFPENAKILVFSTDTERLWDPSSIKFSGYWGLFLLE